MLKPLAGIAPLETGWLVKHQPTSAHGIAQMTWCICKRLLMVERLAHQQYVVTSCHVTVTLIPRPVTLMSR